MGTKKLFLLSLLLIFHFRFVSSKDTIAVNQTIKDGGLLVSKESRFALGFFSPGNSSYRYLGIWFHDLPELNVVWVANRNTPINGSSGFLLLNQYGNLVLYGNKDQQDAVWSANVSEGAGHNPEALLLDSGNFLVQDAGKVVVWQSFDYPTDTLLAGMRLGLNQKTGHERYLTSWRSPDDPGIGNYSLKLSLGGSPQFFLYNGTDNYWRSCPFPWRKYAVVYNYTFVNNPDEVHFAIFQHIPSQRLSAMVDHTGLMKRLMWFDSDSKFRVMWAAPKYRCDSFGQCGPYNICGANSNDTSECDCLPGFEPKSPRDPSLGDGLGTCVRKHKQTSLECEQGEGFVKVRNVNIPDTSGAVNVGMNVSNVECEQQCMSNYSCLAYAIAGVAGEGSACLAWYGEFMSTIEFVKGGHNLHVCVDAIELVKNAKVSTGFLEKKTALAVLVLSISSAWIVVVIVVSLWLRRRRKRSSKLVKGKWSKRIFDNKSLDHYKSSFGASELGESGSNQDMTFFDLNSILAATDNFSPANKLGQGGFGSVYKVEWLCNIPQLNDFSAPPSEIRLFMSILLLCDPAQGQLENGEEIAVKRLSKNSGQGMEEFTNEVKLIAKLQHRNLVKLLGCCIEGEEPMLIYEYLPNKSLDSFLFDQTRNKLLDWRTRFDIIVGVARGVLYLHQDSRLRIIHRDLKTSNILLDTEMNPKISDFGMARILEDDRLQEKTKRVVGTHGYMSPEYALFGKFSIKSDVFSFGVILLEIICGKKNNDFCKEDPCLILIGRVWELWRNDRALEMVDPSLEESYSPQQALRCLQIGLLCVQEKAMDRPTMLAVVFMLNNDMPLPSPKQPAYILREDYNDPTSLEGEGPFSVNEMKISGIVSR